MNKNPGFALPVPSSAAIRQLAVRSLNEQSAKERANSYKPEKSNALKTLKPLNSAPEQVQGSEEQLQGSRKQVQGPEKQDQGSRKQARGQKTGAGVRKTGCP